MKLFISAGHQPNSGANGFISEGVEAKWLREKITAEIKEKAPNITVENDDDSDTLQMTIQRMRNFNPDVTLDRMMVIMLSEVMAHYEIGDGELLNRNKIQKKAEAIMSIDTDELKFKYDDTRRFKVDREKAKELGVSCQKLAADERTRLHDKEIGLYFDAYKTDKENREVLKKNGVNVTPEFLKKYRERYNCKLQDVQIEYIKNEISKGTKDKDIIDFLNISRRTLYNLKKKIVDVDCAKNAEQDTDLLNDIVYNFPRKICTNSEPEKVSENETKDKLQDDTSFDIEPSELRKMLGIPEPVEEVQEEVKLDEESEKCLDMVFGSESTTSSLPVDYTPVMNGIDEVLSEQVKKDFEQSKTEQEQRVTSSDWFTLALEKLGL